MNRINLAMVAKTAGVSKATASFALNHSPSARITQKTRERVRLAARQVGYDIEQLRTPAAKRIKAIEGKRFLMLGDALDAGGFFQPALAGVQAVAKKMKVRLEIATAGAPEEAKEVLGDYLRLGEVDAFILTGYASGAACLLQEKCAPFVIMGDVWSPNQPCLMVKANNCKGGYLAAKTLLDAGHRRIGVVGYHRSGEFHNERVCGVLQAMQELGLPLDRACDMGLDAPKESCADYLDRVLALPQPPTAFVAMTGGICRLFVEELDKRGLRIPDDISLVSFDNLASHPKLAELVTTVEYDLELMGRIAFGKLAHLMMGHGDENTVELVYPQLHLRGSIKQAK